MTGNLSKTFLNFSASMLLVKASVMSSDARPHANRHEPTHVESACGFMRIMASIFLGLVLPVQRGPMICPISGPCFASSRGCIPQRSTVLAWTRPAPRMVTGSHDKTARLWALPEGGRGSLELLRTLRVPIGEGYDGKIYAVALSAGRQMGRGGRMDGAKSTMVVAQIPSTSSMPSPAGLSSALAASAMSSTISPSRPMEAASLPRLDSGEGMRLWETGIGSFSPRTRIIAARTAMARPSTARTGSTPWPVMGKSAAMMWMDISKRRPPRKAARALQHCHCTPMAQTRHRLRAIQRRWRSTIANAQSALPRRYQRHNGGQSQ